jgi:alpha-L-rhamnosidase
MNRREFFMTAAGAMLTPIPARADEFSAVPLSTRLRMHWWVFGTAWTKDEAARQLEMMAKAHVGSVLIFPAHPHEVDDPARGVHNQQYLSAEFFDVLNSVVAKSKELGLVLDIVAGTGWPYGGPSVTPDDSARMLQRVRFPVTSGQPIPLPALKAGEYRIGVFHVRPQGYRDAYREVSADIAGGLVTVKDAVPGSEIQFFYSAPTGQQVKRASAGAEGHVLDHYNAAALGRYMDAVGAKLLAGVPPNSFRSFFCDSLEVYRANWTNAFPKLFQDRRGYDIVPQLPALFDDMHPEAPNLRYDFWRTLSELAKEEFTDPLGEWGRTHGIMMQVEAYGAPPIALAGYQNVQFPCGEGFNWKLFSASRWAASGGRLAGKRLIGDEGWTWLGYPNRFGDSLEQLKVASDLQFLCGINETYGVSYGYSPVRFGAPGWPPYFGPIVNHTQPYWPHFSHLADYIARAQYVLQQGRPITDIALYLGEEDCFAGAQPDELQLRFNQQFNFEERDRNHRFHNAIERGADVITTIATNGYSFDGIDASIFRAGLRTTGGRLRLGDGDYSILVMPNLTGIDVDVLEAIAGFVHGGGTLIATRRLPNTAYGWKDRDAKVRRIRELTTSLFGPGRFHNELRSHTLGQGKTIFCPDDEASLLAALRGAQTPDIEFAEPNRYVGLQHRATETSDFYFVVNTSDEPYSARATFRHTRRAVEFWDPATGRVSTPRSPQMPLAFTLAPYESRFVVLSDAASRAPSEPMRLTANGPGGLDRLPAPLLLSSPWHLRFEDEALGSMNLERLVSWTSIPKARFFSGVASYETQFPVSSAHREFGVLLDLGGVRETASVKVNGEDAGTAWMRPFTLDITRLVRTGDNQLRIDVTNLLINRVLGQGPIDYSKVIARYGDRFPAGDEWELVREPFPSGLLGPVRLVFYVER